MSTKWLLLGIHCLSVVMGCNVCLPCDCELVQISRRQFCSANCSNRNLTSIPDTVPLEVEIMDLSYNLLDSEDLKQLNKYTDKLVKLKLSHNNLNYIPPNSLSTASILQELGLDKNTLDFVNSTSFGFLKQLRKLTGLHAYVFDDLTFENLNGLDDLTITFEASDISENIFKNLKLKTLTIELKSATKIPKNIFNFGVDTLLELYLDVPNVEHLHEDTFSGLTILKSITIKTKKMLTLPTFIFHQGVEDERKMPVNLVNVMIDGVKSLPRNLFDKQQSLKYLALKNIEDLVLSTSESQIDTLDLSGSLLSHFGAELLSGFKSLRFLNISRTRLDELKADSFESLSSLTTLDLSFNNLKEIPDGLFKASQNTLVALNISHNSIQNISRYTFGSVKSLEKLDAGYNMLQYVDENALKGQFMLTELFLNDNELVYLSSDSLVDQSSLVDISIARNKLRQLPSRLFRNARSLKRLDISGNEIETLPADFFQSVRHLEFVSLGENPVHCDCSLMLLRDSMWRVNLVGQCAAPPMLFGIELQDLKLNESCLVTVPSTSYEYSESSVSLTFENNLTNIVSTPSDKETITSSALDCTSLPQLITTSLVPDNQPSTIEQGTTAILEQSIKVTPIMSQILEQSITVSPTMSQILERSITVSPTLSQILAQPIRVSPKMSQPITVSPTLSQILEQPIIMSPTESQILEQPITVSPTLSQILEQPITVSPTLSQILEQPITVSPTLSQILEQSITVSPTLSQILEQPITVSPTLSQILEQPITVSPTLSQILEQPITVSPTESQILEQPITMSPTVPHIIEESITVSSLFDIIPSNIVFASFEQTTNSSLYNIYSNIVATSMKPSTTMSFAPDNLPANNVSTSLKQPTTMSLPHDYFPINIESTSFEENVSSLMEQSTTMSYALDNLSVRIASTSFKKATTRSLPHDYLPKSIESTSFEETSTLHIKSTTPTYLDSTVIQTVDRDSDTPEQTIGGNQFYSSFMGTTAFYIAIGCVVAVFGGTIVGIVIYLTRRKMRSRAYEVTEGEGRFGVGSLSRFQL